MEQAPWDPQARKPSNQLPPTNPALEHHGIPLVLVVGPDAQLAGGCRPWL